MDISFLFLSLVPCRCLFRVSPERDRDRLASLDRPRALSFRYSMEENNLVASIGVDCNTTLKISQTHYSQCLCIRSSTSKMGTRCMRSARARFILLANPTCLTRIGVSKAPIELHLARVFCMLPSALLNPMGQKGLLTTESHVTHGEIALEKISRLTKLRASAQAGIQNGRDRIPHPSFYALVWKLGRET